jgi:hypothetical protein
VADWSSVVGKELSAEGVTFMMYAAIDLSTPRGWVQTSPDDSSYVGGIEPLPVNTWSHLALPYDGAALQLFVNGQPINETPMSGGLLRIGSGTVWGEYFGGLIDEVRTYNRVQTAAEIRPT